MGGRGVPGRAGQRPHQVRTGTAVYWRRRLPAGWGVVRPGAHGRQHQGQGAQAVRRGRRGEARGDPGAWVEPAARRLRSETGRSARVLVLQVPRYAIPRTSSGKPRRRLLGQELMEGTLPATTLVDWRQGIS